MDFDVAGIGPALKEFFSHKENQVLVCKDWINRLSLREQTPAVVRLLELYKKELEELT